MRYRQSLPCGTVEALEERLKQTKNMEVRNGPGFLDSRISEILLGFQAANSQAA